MSLLVRLRIPFLAALVGFLVSGGLASAQLVSISTVTVGDAGNAADANMLGSVGYEFGLGTYEVTIGQYATFLNTVATIGGQPAIDELWRAGMGTDPTVRGISQTGGGIDGDPYVYTVLDNPSGTSSANRPITYVNWFNAARFANWVNNGATATSSTETGAYLLNGATNGVFARQAGATWWLPSQDEWYKAAYYRGGSTNAGYWLYPTQSNDAPGNTVGSAPNQANYFRNGTYSTGPGPNDNHLTDVGAFSGSPGAYGTYDLGGNVYEWNDTTISGTEKGVAGGSWFLGSPSTLSPTGLGSSLPTEPNFDLGFRLATVPEPTSLSLILAIGILGLAARHAFRHHSHR